MAIAPIQNIAIIGGTHGNELTGVYLAKKFLQFPELVTRSSFTTTTILANPDAIALNRRYVDRDLNRCFSPTDLQNPALTTIEDQRAKVIAAQLCPVDDSHTNFIIDIHSTTSNMGLTLLLASDHPFNLRIASYLLSMNPKVKVCFREPSNQASPMLRSLSPFGFTLEVGPVSPGVLNAQQFQETEHLIAQILDYLEAWNHQRSPNPPSQLPIYQTIKAIDYPRDQNDEITAMIHPDLQGRDYQPLEPRSPLFLSLTGEVIRYDAPEIVYPIFINEAAYYEKRIAMVWTQKTSVYYEH